MMASSSTISTRSGAGPGGGVFVFTSTVLSMANSWVRARASWSESPGAPLPHQAADLGEDVAEQLAVGFRADRAARVGRVAADPAPQLQEHRGGMLVGGHRRAEGQKAEVLQHVVQLVEPRVARQPVCVPLC